MSAEKKPFATLQARCALIGIACTETTAGNIVLSRNGGAWIFDTVEQASAWIDRLEQPSMGVPA